MADDAKGARGKHETLDSQLIRYWEREAARFDDLAKRAMFGWITRGYARRAARARAQAEKSRVREAARGHGREPEAAGEADQA